MIRWYKGFGRQHLSFAFFDSNYSCLCIQAVPPLSINEFLWPKRDASQPSLRSAFFGVSAGYKNLNAADTFVYCYLSAVFAKLYPADT